MIISQTPFRVSFFGGGTDYPEFYRRHGGAVLLTAIDKFCYISIHRLSPLFRHRFRASYAKTETVQEPSEFQHPLIRECLTFLGVREGLELAHVADLPGQTGLGTSSSFTVGMLHAVHAFLGHRVTDVDLAREAITVERERVGDAGGHQDQYAAACGGFIRLDFSPDRRVTVKRIPVGVERTRELEDRLLLFYTGTDSSAQAILKEQVKRVSLNEPSLLRMLRMVDEAERIVTGAESLDLFGDLLHESWMLKRGLSSGISNSEIDAAYDAARGCGARGGKLLGAGGRGFLLLYVDPDVRSAVRKRLSSLKEISFSFWPQGSAIIFNRQEA